MKRFSPFCQRTAVAVGALSLLLASAGRLAAGSNEVSGVAPSVINAGAPISTWTVTNSVPATNDLTFDVFLNEVAEANLDIAAQRYNVDIAKAAIAIAKEFPNPTLSLGASRDLRFMGEEKPDPVTGLYKDQTQPQSRSVGIDQTVPYFGKRKWNIRMATQAYHASAATLEDFVRNLKINAAEAYAQALYAQLTFERQVKTTAYLRKFVVVQQKQFDAGDLAEVDLTQSRVDELKSESDLLNAQNTFETAQEGLCAFLGRGRGQTTFHLQGHLDLEPRHFNLGQAMIIALQNRPDLIALRHTRDSLVSGVKLAKATRIPDVDVSVAYNYTTATLNFVDPAPHDDQLDVGLSIPLPLWNRQRAEIQTARAQAGQAEAALQSAELKAEVQLRQTLTSYDLMQQAAQKFQDQALLKGADHVLEVKRIQYEHGDATLLDLLSALSADNDIHQAYNDALNNEATALMEYERAAGSWDVTF